MGNLQIRMIIVDYIIMQEHHILILQQQILCCKRFNGLGSASITGSLNVTSISFKLCFGSRAEGFLIPEG